jgi:hypothetical protein
MKRPYNLELSIRKMNNHSFRYPCRVAPEDLRDLFVACFVDPKPEEFSEEDASDSLHSKKDPFEWLSAAVADEEHSGTRAGTGKCSLVVRKPRPFFKVSPTSHAQSFLYSIVIAVACSLHTAYPLHTMSNSIPIVSPGRSGIR